MMSQYTSRGSNRKAKGKELDPSFGFNRIRTRMQYTPPKLGGKEAKDARRYVNAQKASDELIIYATITPRVNKYTKKPSMHTGSVLLYVFQLDRNFTEGE